MGGDRFLIDKAIVVFNSYTNVDHFTYYKLVKEFHNPETRVVFFAMMADRRRA